MIPEITLNTGAKMPVLGLGTWKSAPGIVGEAVRAALEECGYRHIDCAAIYGNEPEVGEAFTNVFSKKQIKREEVFVTSKLWNNMHRADEVEVACKKSLSDLKLDYLDLYLMHWGVATIPDRPDQPANQRGEPLNKDGVLELTSASIRETWEAMEKLVKQGLVKAIGVANFTGIMLTDLLTYAKIKPAMNQVELHPYNQQQRLVDFCKYNDIAVTGYSPLGSPGNAKQDAPNLLADELILKLSKQYKKTSAQILVRWAIQRGTVTIPKSTHAERLKENIDVFDFALVEADMKEIAGLERRYRFVDPYDWWKIPYFD